MTTLLHIDSSSSFLPSKSRQIAAQFREVWDAKTPDSTVIYRDLAVDPVPHLSIAATKVLAFPAETPEEEANLQRQDALIEELMSADEMLISAPMYNWSIPSTLKAWFDQTLVMGKTLPYDPSTNPLLGRPATVVLAYGGDYAPNSPDAVMDLCGPYLRLVLEKVLGYDLRIITVQQTLAPFTTDDDTVRRACEALFTEAVDEARARAEETSIIHARQAQLQNS